MGTSGAPLNLVEPASGTTGWAANMNANLTAMNAAIAALQAGGTTGPRGPVGAAGPPGIVFTGPWSSLVNYVQYNAVTFNGSCYIASAPNTNAGPDTHPASWALIAAAGAAGPAGPTGPPGPQGSGSGSSVTFPIAIGQGGTGIEAVTTAQILTAIGAAGSGVNSDITELTGMAGLVIGGDGGSAIQWNSPPGALLLTDTSCGGNAVAAQFDTASIGPGDIIVSGTSVITSPHGETITMGLDSARPGASPCNVLINNGLLIGGTAPPSAAAGQFALGCEIASTASTTILGYLVCNNQGTICKIALLAP